MEVVNNMNLYFHELKKLKRSTIIWGIVLLAIILLYMSFFPSMKDLGFDELIYEKMNLFPEAVLKALNLDNMPDFSNYLQYYAYVFQFIIMALYVYALVLGTSIISKEENEKTIEYLYANPISRKEIMTSKLLASFTTLALLMLSIFIFSYVLGIIFASSFVIIGLIKMMVFAFIVLIAYLSIGILLSVILKRMSQGPMIALGVFFGTYILGIISGIVEKLDFLKYVSPYNYAIPMSILRGDVDIIGMIISIFIIVICITLSYIVYNKKDMNI